MTAPTIAEMREAVERAALRAKSGSTRAVLPDEKRARRVHAEQLYAAAETLAVVEWVKRQWPEDWANNVMWFKQFEAERKEGRGDG